MQTDEKKKKKREESFEILENMSRVLPSQLKFVSFKDDSRYKPVKKGSLGGIVCLVDQTPDVPRELMTLSVPVVGATTTATPAVPAAEATAEAVPAPESSEV